MLTPSAINLNKDKNLLTLNFEDKNHHLTSEFLRVYSPSAEVMGHGPGQEVLQVGKENVTIKDIKATGNYAIILVFSDGHDSGIYSWSHLHYLCQNQDSLWESYLNKLADAGHNHIQMSAK